MAWEMKREVDRRADVRKVILVKKGIVNQWVLTSEINGTDQVSEITYKMKSVSSIGKKSM